MENLYLILGITDAATPDEIKRRYRELVMLYHPDKNYSNSHSEETFNKIQMAYETLSDPSKRAAYDLQQKEQVILQRSQSSRSMANSENREDGIITEAFRSAGIWVGFGLWVVSKLGKKIKKE